MIERRTDFLSRTWDGFPPRATVSPLKYLRHRGGLHCTLIRHPLHVLIDHPPTLAPCVALGPCHRHRGPATTSATPSHRMGSVTWMGGRVGDSFSDCPVFPGALMHCSIPAEDIVSREDAKTRRGEPGMGLLYSSTASSKVAHLEREPGCCEQRGASRWCGDRCD
jgi:hypothetical protein